MDLSKLKLDLSPKKRETDPIRIFGGLTQRGQVETLYGPQQEALNAWHQSYRAKSDVLFSMNTGGGKTLVGLLAAQSLVNETRGKVLYVCPTNQLVQQTAAQAEDCGITVATYGSKTWTNEDRYHSAECCCITNYHAAFRGGSPFLNDTIRAILFDDAHVAPATIRSCFTIDVNETHDAWGPLVGIFRGHFDHSPYSTRFSRFTQGDKYESGVLFVPAWFVWEHRAEIEQALSENGIDAPDASTRFAYRHLRDHLASCAFFVSQRGIEITPPIIPTHSLSYFRPDVRRLYLTATLPSRYECIRTFGVDRADTISPTGKIGAAQRLLVFPQGDLDENAYDQSRTLMDPHKTCVIVPSKYTVRKWEDIGTVYDSRTGNAGITEFADATDERKIVLAGIFDGIDLPGEACKVLVLDGIPRGACLHDRYLEDVLDSKKFRLSQTAGRLTQAIGRIFRSNTDHGVVVLADKALQSWLRQPENMAYLPDLLQQQVLLGAAIRKSLEENGEKEAAYPDLMLKVIQGEKDWDDLYNAKLAEIATEEKPKEPAWGDGTARNEYDAGTHMWEGRHGAAAAILNGLGNELTAKDRGLAAWHLHWCGAAHLQEGDSAAASLAFQQAASLKAMLGRPTPTGAVIGAGSVLLTVSPQAKRSVMAVKGSLETAATSVLDRLEGDGGENAEEHEQALCDLGSLLGLESSRPEKTADNKGPDVAWLCPESADALGLEAKTQKAKPAVYKKRDIGQAHDSREWLKQNYSQMTDHVWIVGDHGDVVMQANPPTDLRLVTLESMMDLAQRLINAGRRIDVRPSGASLESATQEAFVYHRLLWPQVAESLEYRFAIDLQDNAVSDED
ncbi:MAG: DEAD/DEAH box helicase family protein [Planctomycetota bacterium]